MPEGKTPAGRGGPEPGASDADIYVAKWLRGAPERELALLFCPQRHRGLAMLWGALCNELDETVFGISDAGVAQTKLAWWAEELAHAAQGDARHPLAHGFFARQEAAAVAQAQWIEVAQAGLRLLTDDASPVDTAALLARHRPYAASLAQVEAALFGSEAAVDAIMAAHLLRAWPTQTSPSHLRWPLHLRARHQADPGGIAPPGMQRDLALELLPLLVATPRGASLRRAFAALDAWRFHRIARDGAKPVPGRWQALWLCWRAARKG